MPNGFSAASCDASLRLPRYNLSQILVMPIQKSPSNGKVKGCQAGNSRTVQQQDRFPDGLTGSGAIDDFPDETVDTAIAVYEEISVSNLGSKRNVCLL